MHTHTHLQPRLRAPLRALAQGLVELRVPWPGGIRTHCSGCEMVCTRKTAKTKLAVTATVSDSKYKHKAQTPPESKGSRTLETTPS